MPVSSPVSGGPVRGCSELADFPEQLARDRHGRRSVGRTSAAVVGGALVAGAGVWLAGPAVAAGLGGKSLLGVAAGAGLGGRAGYSLARAWLRDIPDFSFHEVRSAGEDCAHRFVVVNGFLTEDDENAEDWCRGLAPVAGDSGIQYLNWEAQTLRKLGSALGQSAGGFVLRSFLRQATGAASDRISRRFPRGGAVLAAADLAANPWHSAMRNAEKAGVLLAEAIIATEGRSYTLMGHSLGARVVFFALMHLAERGETGRVRDAVLLGAAVGRDRTDHWQQAVDAVTGRLYNGYSEHDRVLRFLYQGASIGLSRPAGLAPTRAHTTGLVNLDCSDLVDSHNAWKRHLPPVMERIQRNACD